MKVVLLPQAEADLDAATGPLLARLRKRLRALGRYPQLGAAMTGPFAGYRSTTVGQFRVVYKHTARAVLICYIRHCSRA